MSRPSRFSPEQKARAVRMVVEATPNYPSQWAAIESVAAKVGVSSETLRKWVRRFEVMAGSGLGCRLRRLRRSSGCPARSPSYLAPTRS